MDDNINGFYRLNKNSKIKIKSPVFFKAMEDFILRYANISMGGPNYYMFAPSKAPLPPYFLNTKVYSCNLIKNDVPFRWRGRYNEDVILSLDMLKAGWCTIQFMAFLQNKMPTQALKGGNTSELYQAGEHKVKSKDQKYSATGTIPKAKMLAEVHPDVATITWRYGRWHHHVDYTPFKNNKLIRVADLKQFKDVDNYGIELIKK